MNFTAAQHDAIHLSGSLVVTAGAGSGKTRVLVERYLRLLAAARPTTPAPAAAGNAADHPALLAITFTEKAAREMRDRVRAAVEARAQTATNPDERAWWEEQRALVEAARISTIHAFCAALLRAQPAESGIDPQFRLLDEVETALLIAESVDDALSAALASSTAATATRLLLAETGLNDLRAILAAMLRGGTEVRAVVAALPPDPDTLLARWRDELTAARRRALQTIHSSAPAAQIRALTTTAPAGDGIGAQVHALADWLDQAAQMDQMADEPLTPSAPIAAINLRGGRAKDWGGKPALQAAKETLTALRDGYHQHAPLLELAFDHELETRAAQTTLALGALYQQALAHYTHRKAARDALDYDDLEQQARTLLEDYPAVRARWRAEFRAALVDEFQDTNDEQRAIIYALADLSNPQPAPPGPELFIVGDGKQSIYRFRGADVSVFRTVAEDIEAHGGRRVALDTSFRTHARLLTWINQVAEAIFARAAPLRPYEVPFEPLRPFRPPPAHTHCAELHLIEAAEHVADARTREAQALAARIADLVAHTPAALVYDRQQATWRAPQYGDVALLCQTSTVFDYYEAALGAAGIPYLTTAGRGYYGRQEVQDLLHLLRVLNDPADELALVGILRSPLFALDDATIVRLRLANPRSLWDGLLQHTALPASAMASTEQAAALAFARTTLGDLAARRGRLTVVELLRAALASTGYLATVGGLPDGPRRQANIEKLLAAARQAGRSDLHSFSAYLDQLLRAEPREGEAPLEAEGSVRLLTVHRSKGLEFPIVVLPDLGRSPGRPQSSTWLARRAYGLALRLRDETGEPLKPTAYRLAEQEEQQMERAERERLLYVALTRASDYLILSGSARPNRESWLAWLLAATGLSPEENQPASSGPLAIFTHQPPAPDG